MICPVKWIENAEPHDPVTNVAASAVSSRLLVVAGYLRLAAKQPFDDTEHVHQLRVATRRAQAALEIFQRSFTKKQVRWFRKQLKRLRRAAGRARNLDVLIERLNKSSKKGQPRLDEVLVQASLQRQQAQEPIAKLYRQLKHKAFKKRSKAIASCAKWREDGAEPSFEMVARTELVASVEDFFSAATADLSDVQALHQLRIQGKRLRYRMELLAGAFDKSFQKELYPVFAVIQEKLGTINDHATAREYFASWATGPDESSNDDLHQLIEVEDQDSNRKSLEFLDWWTDERLADLRRRFDAALASSPN